MIKLTIKIVGENKRVSQTEMLDDDMEISKRNERLLKITEKAVLESGIEAIESVHWVVLIEV